MIPYGKKGKENCCKLKNLILTNKKRYVKIKVVIKVKRKRSTYYAPKERTVRRLKNGSGRWIRKVAFELNG